MFRYPTITWTIIVLLGWVPATIAVCKAIQNTTGKCNIHGSVQYDVRPHWPYCLPQIVETVQDCALLCARRRFNETTTYDLGAGACKSFRFDTRTNLCQLSTYTVEDGVMEQPNSGMVFYDVGCFDCGGYCDQLYGAQLLDNGGFQEDLLGPWIANSATVRRGPNGQRFFRCTAADQHDGFYRSCLLRQEFNFCPGQLYALEMDYVILTRHANKTASLDVGFGSITHVLSDNKNPNAWKKMRLFFASFQRGSMEDPDVESLPLSIRFDDELHPHPDHQVYVDNVKVSRIPSKLPLKMPVRNLLGNADFETGKLPPWNTSQLADGETVTRNFTIVSPGIDSDYGLYLHSKGAGYPSSSPYLQQTVRTTPSSVYCISFEAFTTGKYATAYIKLYIGAPDNFFTHYFSLGRGNFSTELLVQATTNRTLVRLYAGIGSIYPSSLLLDNFRMREIAESKYFS